MGRPKPTTLLSVPKEGEPAIHRAARTGDDEEIRRLVDSGVPVDLLFAIQLFPTGPDRLATPLMVAVGSTHGATASTVEVLLELGASLVPFAETSVMWVACAGLGAGHAPPGGAERVAVLLEAGAEPNENQPRRRVATTRYSVLAAAAGNGNAELVRLLLDAGADPCPLDTTPDDLPLWTATRCGSRGAAELLLASGAPVDVPMSKHDDPVLARAGSLPVLELLLAAGADPNAPCAYGQTIVGCAAEARGSVEERLALVERLVAAGADLNHPDPNPLVHAAMGSADEVEVLLRAGADPTIGRPLGMACFNYSRGPSERTARKIRLLIEAGISPDDEDDYGYRPLHGALSPDTWKPGYGESDGVGVAETLALLRCGASIDITWPGSGDRPLHAAAAAGSTLLVEALLARGADPRERNGADETPADVARARLDHLRRMPEDSSRADYLRDGSPQRSFEYLLSNPHDDLQTTMRCIDLLAVTVI